MLLLLGAFFVAALAVPAVVVARPGLRFGTAGAYRLGLSLWSLGLGLSLACASAGVLVPASTLPYQLVLAPVLLGAYAGLTRGPSVPRLTVLALVFALPSAGVVLSVA